MSEYAHSAEKAAPREREPGVLGRLAAGLVDRARSSVGAPTGSEIAQAEGALYAARTSPRVDQKLAASVASGLDHEDRARIETVLPGLAGVDLPSHPALRRVAIAREAIDVIHRHVDHGPHAGLTDDVARKARIAGADDLLVASMDRTRPESLVGALEARGAMVAAHVSSYLAVDEGVAARIDVRVARSLSRGIPADRERIETEMAQARLGMVDASLMVARAVDFGKASVPLEDWEVRAVSERSSKSSAPSEIVAAEVLRGRAAAGRGPDGASATGAKGPVAIASMAAMAHVHRSGGPGR